ncbi:hypothetical protein AAHC03_04602 [Spirometra sp. Aus1]
MHSSLLLVSANLGSYPSLGSGGRKGLLQTRWRFGNTCLDLVNVHLFNDTNNLITVKNFPHDLSVARMEKLGLELASLQEARCFDEEPGPFEGSLFEYPIQFRPSYPFSEDPSKPSEYASSRFPAWCDRVFISRSALSLLDIRDAIYGLLCEDVSVGDHKPVFLQLTLADDAFAVNQDQRKIDEPELVTKNDDVVSQEHALE